MSVTLLGETALQRRLAALGGPNAFMNWHRLVGMAAVREQKLLVHRKTGNTGRTIHLASATPQMAVTSAGGAAVFSLGTQPHIITPKAAMALRFAPGGGSRLSGSPRVGAALVFAKIVHHPGNKPWPFMLPGAVAAVQAAGVEPFVAAWNGGGL
jgi:hypothetical protein